VEIRITFDKSLKRRHIIKVLANGKNRTMMNSKINAHYLGTSKIDILKK
jgi:hypothetical protein